MRSFQQWLNYQTYSCHLKNLMNIKNNPREHENKKSPTSFEKTTGRFRLVNQQKFSSPDSRIRSRAKKTQKTQLQEYELVKENICLANRINNVHPVISADKQLTEYKKYQAVFKKNTSLKQNRQESKKQVKFNNFMKLNHTNYKRNYYKGILKIRLKTIPKVYSNKNSTFWLQIILPSEKMVSSYVTQQEITSNQISVLLKKKIPSQIKIILNCCKGLNHFNLGQYIINVQTKSNYVSFDLTDIQNQTKHIVGSIFIEEFAQQQKQNKCFTKSFEQSGSLN